MPSVPGGGAGHIILYLVWGVVALAVFIWLVKRTIVVIGADEVGLVRKRIGKELKEGIIAFNGETGYQARLKKPGWHFMIPLLYVIERIPRVRIGSDEIGVVIAQVGKTLPPGRLSGEYRPEYGNYEDVEAFVTNGGEQGVQRIVLPPGTVAIIHPVAFLVITSKRVYGKPVEPRLASDAERRGGLSHQSFGLRPEQLKRVVIEPGTIGIIETLEGPALDKDQVAGRLGGFEDVEVLEAELRQQHPLDGLDHKAKQAALATMAEPLMDIILERHLDGHSSYQNYQAFLDHGGRMGIQHDVLPPGSYSLNPFLVNARTVPMLSVEQSEVAVIRSAVGLRAEDVSGAEFKFGSLTLPGHRGLWCVGLRTGFYALNPDIYNALMVPTNVITLSWSGNVTAAQDLDKELSPIQGTSKDGFPFTLELQVQVHVPADQAPHLISLVGHMEQLVNGILQPAVGSFFRDAMQSRTATQFIEERNQIRAQAEDKIREVLAAYFVQVQGVFIQAVRYPDQIAQVLQEREIAVQQRATLAQQQLAEQARIDVEKTRGEADAQKTLADAAISVKVAKHKADAARAEAEGQAAVTTTVAKAEAESTQLKGVAQAKAIQAKGLAEAEAYKAQVAALGQENVSRVAALREIATGKVKITPDVLVGSGGSPSDALVASVLAATYSSQSTTPTSAASDGKAAAV